MVEVGLLQGCECLTWSLTPHLPAAVSVRASGSEDALRRRGRTLHRLSNRPPWPVPGRTYF